MKLGPRALVLRAPGINCERETVYACRLAGFETQLLHINELLPDPERLLAYHLLVIPGGFSYGDDLGAGTLLARNLTIHLGAQLRRFVEEGRPVLGICNGFQVLVRAGLLPSVSWEHLQQTASLTMNASARFECRWVSLLTESTRCIFTRGISRPLELPVAHGEGRFVLADPAQLEALRRREQIALLYDGDGYPANPNGSQGNIAGLCNAEGTVLGMMPHPERYVRALQHPHHRGDVAGYGDGLLLFHNAYAYVCQLLGLARDSAQESLSKESEARERLALAGTSGERPLYPLLPMPAYAAKASGQLAAPQTTPSLAEAVQRETGGAVATPPPLSYAASGVDIAAGERAVALMEAAVRATQGPEVLAGVGAFAGVFRAGAVQALRAPALVATTDGVGTKTLLAMRAQRFESIGFDLVNHCVNDLLTQGARPLFFLDYLATGRLDAEQAAAIVESVARACQAVGCALLGGETAEMPDVYLPGTFDLAGTLIGLVEEHERINPATIRAGDVLLGLPSSGLHTNGYSLARRVFATYPLETVFPELGEPLGEALLRPHRCYLAEITRLRAAPEVTLRGIAHITGGAFPGNISRLLPAGTCALIDTAAWEVPPLFRLLARLGGIEDEEMYRTFNMGIGMVLVVPPESVEPARRLLPELVVIGSIEEDRKGRGVALLGIEEKVRRER